MGETNHAVIGLASHVPHYLADLDYPESARALVEALRGATGLALPINSLAVAANTVRAEIDTQVNNSEELKAMLHALEEQYDS
ncbi:PAC2 family protein, partial [Neisseria sp. P0015.S004]